MPLPLIYIFHPYIRYIYNYYIVHISADNNSNVSAPRTSPIITRFRPQYKKVNVNLRRCLYECDLSCARCWWLLYGNAEPGPGFPSCPAGSCGIRPDGSGIFYLGWPVPDAPVLSGRIHGFQVVINYTNYHQKPAEIFVQITVINNLNSTGIRANIQTT